MWRISYGPQQIRQDASPTVWFRVKKYRDERGEGGGYLGEKHQRLASELYMVFREPPQGRIPTGNARNTYTILSPILGSEFSVVGAQSEKQDMLDVAYNTNVAFILQWVSLKNQVPVPCQEISILV